MEFSYKTVGGPFLFFFAKKELGSCSSELLDSSYQSLFVLTYTNKNERKILALSPFQIIRRFSLFLDILLLPGSDMGSKVIDVDFTKP
jgi:hypothetical protein